MARLALFLVIFSLLILIALTILVHYHTVFRADILLSQDLQNEGDSSAKKDALYHFFVFVSYFGQTLVAAAMVTITAVVFWLFHLYRETIFTFSVFISTAIDWLVKYLVNRPRPTDSLVRVLDKQATSSFPSGHVVFYTVFFGFLIAVMLRQHKLSLWVRIPVALISMFFISTVAFSRIYLGAHWASDVAGGYFLGFACLIILVYYYLKDNKAQ